MVDTIITQKRHKRTEYYAGWSVKCLENSYIRTNHKIFELRGTLKKLSS